MTTEDKAGPLRGIKVIELAGIGPAPYACMLLSDLGAEVLRLERSTGTFAALLGGYDMLARGRRTVAIDLKATARKALVLDLVKEADVLIEAFRPGVAERLGVGPDDCLGANPRLVYARMTGWGQDGPLATGSVTTSTTPPSPARSRRSARRTASRCRRSTSSPTSAAARCSAVMGVLAALLERNTSGKGQVIDVAMVDGVTSLLVDGAQPAQRRDDERRARQQPARRRHAVLRHLPAALTGSTCPSARSSRSSTSELKQTLELPDLPSQAERDRYPEVREMLAAKFATKTRDEWVGDLRRRRRVCRADLVADRGARPPSPVARETLVDVGGVMQPAPAPRFSRTPGEIGARPKPPGPDTIEALSDWGIDDTRVKELLESGAVTQAES